MSNTEIDKKSLRFKEENTSKLFFGFMVSTLTALIFNSIYNITDTLFVSWGVGDNAMGGVSIVFPFVMLQGAISTAVGGGASSLISRKLGKGDRTVGGEIAINAMAIFYLTAIIISALGLIFVNPILKFMGVTDELFAYAKEYFIIILIGNVFSTGFSSIMRAEGKMKYSLLIWIIPITLNIILDAIFILWFKMGVKGSALATVVSQFTSFIIFVYFFTKVTSLKFDGAKVRFSKIKEITEIGIPSLVQMGTISLISIILNNAFKAMGGTLWVNALAYVTKVLAIGIIPFTAVSQALSPIIGYNFGSGDNQRIKETLKISVKVSFIYAIIACVVTFVFAKLFISIFTESKEIIDIATAGLKVVSLSFIFAPFPIIVGASAQAVGKKTLSLLIFASNLLFIMPSLYIGQILSNSLSGMWWGYNLTNMLSTILAIVIFRKLISSIFKFKNNEIIS